MANDSAQKPSAPSKGPAIMFFAGAFAVLMFAILTVVNASAWFNYVSAAVFLALAITLAYRGVWLLLHSRVANRAKR
ncbi:hypothetical protein GY21_10300 [Cryobacterium roopkundense]|uniref:High-affinity Fe2+/Pb2+ permease n=1 Tax=Cryobacterium roopkundense TaxID=1001240 RepID=A0A099J8F2_9MICO|nr:hypothetical protein [Cryobacterium roopkundense]KGJ74659.1 hypothetical protein GY21_10300 [Cryobacterium roopkundense]MBB5640030.1 high-affinity Fe2+/Pb2+ permease [Cryobacterium roopkundense]